MKNKSIVIISLRRPWINIDSASYSVPVKKQHLSADVREIVKTLQSSLLNKGLNASTTAREKYDLTKLPLTKVGKVKSH